MTPTAISVFVDQEMVEQAQAGAHYYQNTEERLIVRTSKKKTSPNDINLLKSFEYHVIRLHRGYQLHQIYFTRMTLDNNS